MSERQAFLRGICENPDEPERRLAFADWLQDHGEPDRAEFVMVQCELAVPIPEAHDCGRSHPRMWEYDSRANCKRCQWMARWGNHRARERALLREHYDQWALEVLSVFGVRAGLPMALDSRLSHESFRRGFVEVVECDWPDAWTHLPAIRKAAPLARVVLTTWPDGEWLHFAGFDQQPTDDGNRRLALSLLAAEYPGLEWELPANSPSTPRAAATPLG